MKKLILFAGVFMTGIIFSTNLWAQEPGPHKKKSEEIIIKKDGDKTTKMTIEIDGDKVTVNGKPLSDYHDGDVSIMQKDFMDRDSHNFLYAPDGDENMNLQLLKDDFNNSTPKTFLGVMMDKVDEGVKVTDVVKGSGAEKAGLLKGDIITKVDDKKISESEDLMSAVTAHKPGDEIKVYYLRDNKKKDAKVKLGETKQQKRTFNFNGNGPHMENFDFNTDREGPMGKLKSMKKLYNFNYNDNDKPKLGVKIEDTENESGAKIISVDEGSAADKAGLKKDDIITSVNDEKVSSVDEVKDQLDEAEDKATIHVKAMRNNSEMNFDIKIPKKLNSADL